MSDRVVSFSVKPSDTEASDLVDELKMLSVKTGKTFSRMCIDALKLYKERYITNE